MELVTDQYELNKALLEAIESGPIMPNDKITKSCNEAWLESTKNWMMKIEKLLLDGADIDCRSLKAGCTPLMLVCGHQSSLKMEYPNPHYAQIINFMADTGCQIKLIDKYGMTALHHAACSGQYYACKVLLYIAKSECTLNEMVDFIDIKDSVDNLTATEMARANNNHDIVNLLTKWRECACYEPEMSCSVTNKI